MMRLRFPAARRSLAAIDRVTLVYVGAMALALAWLWRDGLSEHWIWIALAHALLAVLAVLAPAGRAGPGPLGRFLGDWYPLVVLGGLYSVIGIINLDEAHAYDLTVQQWEAALFGMQPSYAWIRAWPNLLVSWILHLCYLGYYLMLYGSPLGLWLGGRRHAARVTILAVMVTFYLCYIAFVLFPVTGPRYMFPLAENAATAITPARLTQWLLNRGDAWGAAFPSSHVAACVVAAGMAFAGWRKLGLVLCVPTLGLTLAVVYGQFHYAIDALGGLLLAALILLIFGPRARSVGAVIGTVSPGAVSSSTLPSAVRGDNPRKIARRV